MADAATSKLNILVKVQDEASADMRRLSNDVSDLGGSMDFAGMKAGVLAGAMAAIAGAAIWQSIKAFEEAEVQMARFDTIVRNLPPHLQAYRGRILETADAAMKLGFDNETAAVSIARLFQVTGDAEFAFKAFRVAMDFARYKGISLEAATQALILSFSGGGRMLREFGIEVDEHASKETILAAVFQHVQGHAEAYVETLRGATEVLRGYTGEVQEAVGQPFAEFIKIVKDKLIGWIDMQGGMNVVLDKFNTHLAIAGALLAGIFLTGIIVATAMALTAIGPFGLIVAAVMALIGVIALLAASWLVFGESIKNLTKSVEENVMEVFGRLQNWIQENIISWFEEKVGWIKKQIEKMKQWASQVKETIMELPGRIIGGAREVLGSRQLGGYIPETGPYLLHKGEYVVPSRLVGAGIGGGVINVYLQGDFFTDAELAKKFGDILAKEIKYQLKL